MPQGCGHGPDDGNADCSHDGDSGWGWSGSEPGERTVYKESYGDFYFLLVVAALVLGFLAWVLSPIYM